MTTIATDLARKRFDPIVCGKCGWRTKVDRGHPKAAGKADRHVSRCKGAGPSWTWAR